MFGPILFFALFVGALAGMKKWKRPVFLCLAAIGFFGFIVESLILVFFMLQIFQGNCYFLLGKSRFYDVLIKARLMYSVYYAQDKKFFIYQVNNDLGYTVGKNKNTGVYATNADSVRADREYAIIPDENTLRIAAFGDSYVFCDDEKNADTWPYRLEKSASRLEVLNFGVSGYGFAQSYLRYLKDGLKYHPDIITINYLEQTSRDFLSAKDIVTSNNLRLAHLYRPLLGWRDGCVTTEPMTPYKLFDPEFRRDHIFNEARFEVETRWRMMKRLAFSNTGLLLQQCLFKQLVQHYTWPKNFEDQDIHVALLENFLKTAALNGTTVVFTTGIEKAPDAPEKIAALLRKYQDGIVYFPAQKLMNAQVKKAGSQDMNLKNSSNHLNAQGNIFYAQGFLEFLKSKTWGRGDRQFVYDPQGQKFVRVKQAPRQSKQR
ncbi:MAG: SGNH/GDSL hydrolase family protein [Candidatus Omnitrophica bacterium]|nr:SGNH/GDSL hydrolase family protein [Candidatus Omnitrophota bacterium]